MGLSNMVTVALSLMVLALSFVPLRKLDARIKDNPPLWLEEEPKG